MQKETKKKHLDKHRYNKDNVCKYILSMYNGRLLKLYFKITQLIQIIIN